VAPRQLAISASQPTSLYALGNDGIVRIDLDTSLPPPQTSADIDLVSPIVIALLFSLPVLALLMRRRRRGAHSVAATAHREVGLHAENRAQRQHQQAHADQDLLVAHQTERKDQPTNQDH